MEDIGVGKLLLILLIILVLFGGGKLPEIGRSLGQAIREFKNAMRDSDPREASKSEKQDDGAKDPKA
jgi:sec-independent protein translocase protein TatA